MYTDVKQLYFTASALSLGPKNVDQPVSLTAFNSDVGGVNYACLEVSVDRQLLNSPPGSKHVFLKKITVTKIYLRGC